ncbi:MAG: hypothetical protein L6Q54_06825 [Leptospiraceae bacterium]|nr:hypothetical protein [Leptospiraceae bacterium]MCK6380951.1 hypothetical protein [Leptospiraceae bacterium]NUM40954.1 hypothetical protein [Leptospiraceae bacterium]
MKYNFLLSLLALAFSCSSPIVKTYDIPVMSVKSLPYPLITSYESLGKVIGKACVKNNESNSFVNASHIGNLSPAEQAAYFQGLSTKPEADLLVSIKTVQTTNPDTNEVCAEVRGEAVAIKEISKEGKYKQVDLENQNAGINPLATNQSNKKSFDGICNIPFIGGMVNAVTIGLICIPSIRRKNNMTACEIPLFGVYPNLFTLGWVCQEKYRIFSF